MNYAANPDPTTLLDNLKLLCTQSSVSGQTRELTACADDVASILRDVGLNCSIVKTPGAPIVIGTYDAGAEHTLLLYARYDVPPAGLRRSWTNDPFQPTVRNEALYARGAVAKAELVARAMALRTLIARQVPLNITMVVEGESVIGSPYLGLVHDQIGPVYACLWSGGGFDADGVPVVYTGVKGLLQVELRASTAQALVPASYAATVPNPIWTLTLALSSIKSEYEEILIDGFYDDIVPPSRAALNMVQNVDVGEQARRDAWGIGQFVAHVKGPMLTRTETFSPSCNVSEFNVSGGSVPAIPQRASAELQFQLVPDLQPARVFELLRAHLEARGLDNLQVVQLPGAYPSAQSTELPFDAASAAASVYSRPAAVLPLAPFAAPVALLVEQVALVSCGLERPTSALVGPDEHVPLADVLAHTHLLIELITRIAV